MKKYVDGKYYDMTPEEIEATKELETALENIEPTVLERLEAIETLLLEGVLIND